MCLRQFTFNKTSECQIENTSCVTCNLTPSACVRVAGVHLAHQRRGADRGDLGAHALRQRRGLEPRAPRRARVRLRRLLAAPVGPAPRLLLVPRTTCPSCPSCRGRRARYRCSEYQDILARFSPRLRIHGGLRCRARDAGPCLTFVVCNSYDLIVKWSDRWSERGLPYYIYSAPGDRSRWWYRAAPRGGYRRASNQIYDRILIPVPFTRVSPSFGRGRYVLTVTGRFRRRSSARWPNRTNELSYFVNQKSRLIRCLGRLRLDWLLALRPECDSN